MCFAALNPRDAKEPEASPHPPVVDLESITHQSLSISWDHWAGESASYEAQWQRYGDTGNLWKDIPSSSITLAARPAMVVGTEKHVPIQQVSRPTPSTGSASGLSMTWALGRGLGRVPGCERCPIF
ncbi:unnamed protein product [Discosporangium mesarthrocarpum]